MSSRGGTLLDSGRLVNEARGVIDVTGLHRGALMTVSGSFDNLGTLNIGSGLNAYDPVAAGTVAVSGILHNSGYISVGGYRNPYGGGALLSISGSLDNVGTIFVTGIYEPSQTGETGQTLEIAGVLNNRGQITLQSGGINQNYPGVGGLLLDNGTLENSGTLTIEGKVGAVTGGTVVVNGVFSNTGTVMQQQDSRIVVNGSLTNDGAITIAGGVGTAAGELAVMQRGVLSLGTGTIQGGGVLLNQGTIVAGGGFSVISGVSFINDGTVDISDSSLLTIDSAVTSDPGKTGVFNISGDGTLALNGAVAASETVSIFMDGYRNLLELGNAATFSGTLSGLGATDTIDFLKQDITSATTTGDTLAVGVAGGETIDLVLAMPLLGLSLTLQSDGNGGTDLLFGVAPTH
jgi:hypothetical protein